MKHCTECICKSCPENHAFVMAGNCTGCDECGKASLCLVTGEPLIGPTNKENKKEQIGGKQNV